jgi:predicted MFS family arabinose efflux permease
MALLRAGVGFLTFLVAFALKADHEPAWFFGAVLAVSAVGGFVGNVLAPVIRRRFREEWILVSALVLPALVALWAARSGGRWSFVFTSVMVAASAAAGKVAFDSLLQRDGPDDLRGRAFARFETRFQLVWVVGALVPVALFDVMDARVGFFVLACVLGFAGLSYVGGLRAARDRDRPDPESVPRAGTGGDPAENTRPVRPTPDRQD